MSSNPDIDAGLRDRILSAPDVVLDDHDIMRALVAANERTMGTNIVDLRGIAMDRLEARLDRLEDTHRSVIAAAYENLAGTNQVHRAILTLLEPTKFEVFLSLLGSDIASTLRVDVIRLVLETTSHPQDDALEKMDDVLAIAAPGFIDDYLTLGRALPVRQVTMRQMRPTDGIIYGNKAEFIHSEACLKLDLGKGRLPGLLVMGSEDPHQFTPQQGPDLLAFFSGVFERVMQRWLG